MSHENQEESNSDCQPSLLCYRSMRLKTNKGKGQRINFQFTLDEDDLYRSKLKMKHQTKPIPIGIGSEVHYSGTSPYVLYPNSELSHFVLKHEGEEIITIKFKKRKNGPKKADVKFKENGVEIHLVSRKPEKTDIGKWCLDFDGRYAEPSIKNCILVEPGKQDAVAMFRRLDQWEMNVDAKEGIPDILLFAVLLSLNLCQF